jgi:hypothetical protein
VSGYERSTFFWIVGGGLILLGAGLWIGGDSDSGRNVITSGVVWVALAVGVHIGAAGGRFDRD